MILNSGLLDPTPATPASLIDGTASGLGSFAVAAEGGRVSANIDKARARQLMTMCPKEWNEAMAKVRKSLRPKFLGIF